jgi:hypothetical protein
MTLQRGDIVPHFDVRTTSRERFSYSAIWQRKNLVLIILSATAAEDEGYMRDDPIDLIRPHRPDRPDRPGGVRPSSSDRYNREVRSGGSRTFLNDQEAL